MRPFEILPLLQTAFLSQAPEPALSHQMEGPRDPDLAALQLALKRLQTAPAVCRGPRHRCDGGRGPNEAFQGEGDISTIRSRTQPCDRDNS
ncbi:hypothetical protein ROHU_018634 [Labeo rohita]|uniref:Uncharacterized protein n=1 Tax=Labeo rohita TaxID=84645 RepID=A0A498NEJ6_LABRO|nr:hypothetical protein ROHU_018634 [Labeo rohita]